MGLIVGAIVFVAALAVLMFFALFAAFWIVDNWF